MPTPKLTFDYHGVELSGSDFSRDLKGWVAFSIAFTFATRCRDKDAAIELLNHEAEKIIQQVKEKIIQQVKKGRAPQ